MKKQKNDCLKINDNILKILLEIKYKIVKIETKLGYHEKLIFLILGSIIAIIIKVFLL